MFLQILFHSWLVWTMTQSPHPALAFMSLTFLLICKQSLPFFSFTPRLTEETRSEVPRSGCLCLLWWRWTVFHLPFPEISCKWEPRSKGFTGLELIIFGRKTLQVCGIAHKASGYLAARMLGRSSDAYGRQPGSSSMQLQVPTFTSLWAPWISRFLVAFA